MNVRGPSLAVRPGPAPAVRGRNRRQPGNGKSPRYAGAPGAGPQRDGYFFFSRLSTNDRTPSGGSSYLVGRSLSVGPTTARMVSPLIS